MIKTETQKPGRLCVVATPKFRAMVDEIVAALGYATATQAIYAAVIEMRRNLSVPEFIVSKSEPAKTETA